MDEEQKKALEEMMANEGVELSDEALEGATGGAIYHDQGDIAAHRKEAYYVVDDEGVVVMRLDSSEDADHWAKNLHTSTTLLTADEFAKMRRRRRHRH